MVVKIKATMDTKLLIQLLEQQSGHAITSSGDCEWLARDLKNKTNEAISANSLKRILGFLPYNKSHRTSTMDIIARYLEHKSWEDLNVSLSSGASFFGHNPNVLFTEALQIGDIVEVTYRPDIHLKLEYTGGNKFVLEQSDNKDLLANDIAVIYQFVISCPVVASRVLRDGRNLGEYTAARYGGITSFSLLKAPETA